MKTKKKTKKKKKTKNRKNENKKRKEDSWLMVDFQLSLKTRKA
jgi:hypothetical protein